MIYFEVVEKCYEIVQQDSKFLTQIEHLFQYKTHKVNSVQEACAKCFAVYILKFEILQTT